MGIDNPSGRTLEYQYATFIWQTYYIVATEPLSAWRNGIAIVVDLKGAGLRNLDIHSPFLFYFNFLFFLFVFP